MDREAGNAIWVDVRAKCDARVELRRLLGVKRERIGRIGSEQKNAWQFACDKNPPPKPINSEARKFGGFRRGYSGRAA